MVRKAVQFAGFSVFFLSTSFLSSSCTSDTDPVPPSEESGDNAPSTYKFESRFQEGESSVSYSGQTFRHLLISDLTSFIEGLQEEIESNADFDPSQVEASLLGFYEFDSDTSGGNPILLTTDPESLQEIYDDVATDKDLAGKIAGQDSNGEKDHKDWSKEFVGWNDESIAVAGGDITSPDGLMRAFFATVAENATLQVNGDPSRDGLKTYQTASGQDLAELVQKVLLGALAFSQAADDYLDEGLDSNNTEPEDGETFSELEHAWDEGFGYFGAAREFLEQREFAVAYDSNDDGQVDLLSEFNWGPAAYAARRDGGSQTGTAFATEAMNAFLEGRFLISQQADHDEIQEQAEIAVRSWEKSMAASAVHYLNSLLEDQAALGTDEYSFDSHAAHWSELKGFALAFQFNKNSPLSDDDFAELHNLIGDAPLLSGATDEELSDYEDDLLTARQLLQEAYELETDDVENW